MATRTVFREAIPEKSTWRYTAIIKDEKGAAIPAASLATLELTLYNLDDLALVNTVDHVNILNNGRGTVDASGNLAITFDPNDASILDANRFHEHHIALIEWGFPAAGGTKKGRHEVEHVIQNLAKVG